MITNLSLRLAAVTLAAGASLTAAAYHVSTEPQNKHVLFEEFTGTECNNCPDGARTIQTLTDANPGKIHTISIYEGYYAPARPDFHTVSGAEIHDHFEYALYSYPSALINRHQFQNAIVSQHAFFSGNVATILKEEAPVNLWMNVRCDLDTRKVIVDVEGYCTSDLTTNGKAYLTVAMTQSGVRYYQKGAADPNNYIHNHILRDFLTPTWGDELTDCFEGNFFAKRYEYDLPEQIGYPVIVPENLEFVAFVAAGQTEVLNSTAATPSFDGLDPIMDVTFSPYKISMPTSYAFDFIEFFVTNESNEEITSAVFELEFNGEPDHIAWDGSIKPGESELIELPVDMATANSKANKYSIKCIEINGKAEALYGLNGTFDYYAKDSSPRLSITIRTDGSSTGNTFYIKDAQGSIVKEFKPGGTNSTPYEETVELDVNCIYCFEVNVADGNGLINPEGCVTIYDMASGSPELMISQSNIEGYGWRYFFQTTLPAEDVEAGVEGIGEDTGLLPIEVYDLNGRRILTTGSIETASGQLPAGIYILKRGSEASKIVIK